jgi:hypothetical protein
MMTTRAALAAATALLAAGVLELALGTNPWPGAVTIAAGLLLQWRARLAQREAAWDAITRPEEADHASSTSTEEDRQDAQRRPAGASAAAARPDR